MMTISSNHCGFPLYKNNVQILYSIGYCYDHSKLFLKKYTNTILGSILAYKSPNLYSQIYLGKYIKKI